LVVVEPETEVDGVLACVERVMRDPEIARDDEEFSVMPELIRPVEFVVFRLT
jgi:hypothetical protein